MSPALGDVLDVLVIDPVNRLGIPRDGWGIAIMFSLAIGPFAWRLLGPEKKKEEEKKKKPEDAKWDSYFLARGFDAARKSEETGAASWRARFGDAEWLVYGASNLEIVVSAPIDVDPDLLAVPFEQVDLLAWALRRSRKVPLPATLLRQLYPVYSDQPGLLASWLTQVGALKWNRGRVQLSLEKRKLRVVFNVGRHAIDDSLLAAASDDFALLRGCFPGGPVDATGPRLPRDGTECVRLERRERTYSFPMMLAAVVVAIAAMMSIPPALLHGQTGVILMPLLGVAVYLATNRVLTRLLK
ncbi:MAG: hypothetical protein HYZ74_08370 [Elusimicrobia bacterium]|nr:hypothetical protein [Elusimicrobiota bacterium]